MNRNTIRGITAAGVAGGLLGVAAFAVPAIARGAVASDDPHMSVAAQQAVMDWHLPDAGRYLRQAHPRKPVTHRTTHASRSSYRAPLTGSPQTVAHALVLQHGWSESEYTCLNTLWTRESGWQTYAANGSSGAYGIPQALPGYKMASFGSDWRTNPITQIKWGLWYIGTRYGTPCAALQHSYSYSYY